MRHRIFALMAALAVVVGGATTMVLRPAYAAMACTVDYTVTREWSNGWLADLTLTNLGAPLTDWRLRFRIAGSGQTVNLQDQLPPGWAVGTGELYPLAVLVPPPGHTLPAGGSVTVRFGGNFPTDHPVLGSPNPEPVDYVLAGQPCNVDLPTTSPSRSPSPSPSPSPDPAPPSVVLTSPRHNDFFAAPATIPIRADATASAGRRIERVEFRERGTLLAVDTTAPYAFDWRGVPPNGGTRITATAYDSDGGSVTTEVRGVRVLPPPAPGAAPALKVVGDQIMTVERHPRPYRPRGITRSTVEAPCGPDPVAWDGPVDDASVRALRARGVNAVRIVLSEACWRSTDTDTFPRREDRLAYVGAAAGYAERLVRHGITPIVALRPTTATSGGGFWPSMAQRFGDGNAVVFDLTNPLTPAVGATDPATAWSCWQQWRQECNGVFQAASMRDRIRGIRNAGAFNVVLAGGLDGGNDASRWLAHRPADPDGRNLAAAWRVDNRSACATPACWQSTLLPLAAEVPVVAVEVSADASAPSFVPRAVSWLDRHGIGHVRG